MTKEEFTEYHKINPLKKYVKFHNEQIYYSPRPKYVNLGEPILVKETDRGFEFCDGNERDEIFEYMYDNSLEIMDE
jgi:hypothetical protein